MCEHKKKTRLYGDARKGRSKKSHDLRERERCTPQTNKKSESIFSTKKFFFFNKIVLSMFFVCTNIDICKEKKEKTVLQILKHDNVLFCIIKLTIYN